MSEHITHTVQADDCRLLILGDDALSAQSVAAARERSDLMRAGAISMRGDHCNPALLAHLRQAREAGLWGDEERDILAFVLGWVTHRATDRQFKPVFRRYDPDCPRKPTDCSIHHDAFLLRERLALHYGPVGVDWPAGLDRERLQQLFTALTQGALVSLHTVRPDEADPLAWIRGRLLLHRRAYVDLERLVTAALEPDPDQVERFIVAPRFYDHDDPMLRACAAGEPVRLPQVDRAGPLDHDRCLYVRALIQAYRYVLAADAYLTGRIDSAALEQALEIGRPEIDFTRV